MKDPTAPSPFEILGILGSADRALIERRGEALTALLKLGLAPPEGDAIKCEDLDRTPEDVTEAVRRLRDPHEWLREIVLWPDGGAGESALDAVADLLEGAAGRSAEPAALVRQLAHQYLNDEISRHRPTDQPKRWLERRLTPPAKPELYLAAGRYEDEGGSDDS